MTQPARPLAHGARAIGSPAAQGGDLEQILDLLGDLTGEISWTVHQSMTWVRGNPLGRGLGSAPCCRPMPSGGLARAGLLGGHRMKDFSSQYRPAGDAHTDPRQMIEALAHYEHALRELVDEAHDRLAGALQP